MQGRPIRCTECRRPWAIPRERWRAYLADIDRECMVGFYCPVCAAYEFGDELVT
jgi:hypothetical protein